MKNKFSTFFKPVRYWIDKTCVQAKKVCKYVNMQVCKLNIHKLQDNLRHITYTHKSRIRCTPRLKYRLDISIFNDIVTTI